MVKAKVLPAPGYLLVKPLACEKTTASGIVLPESHEEKPQEGKVVVLGPTLINEYGNKLESPCKKGDLIIFKKWAGSEYKPEGEENEFLFVKFDEVLAVIK
ncbi:MAG: co-chaperone GroES [Candidatus Shapirobacteria bacterium]